MTKALNKSIIEGRTVRIPTLKETQTGIPYCHLIVAVNEIYYVAGHSKKNTSYISVAIWNKTAEACCRYLQKGQKVRIVGKLRQSVWTNNSGIKHSKVEINCESIQFLDRPQHKPVTANVPSVSSTNDIWASSNDDSNDKETDWAEVMADADLQEI